MILEAREEFIPFEISCIIYDKLLDRSSIHHYRFNKISFYPDFKNEIYPEVTDTEELINQLGISRVLEYLGSRRYPSSNKRYYLALNRIVKPLCISTSLAREENSRSALRENKETRE